LTGVQFAFQSQYLKLYHEGPDDCFDHLYCRMFKNRFIWGKTPNIKFILDFYFMVYVVYIKRLVHTKQTI